MIDYIECRNANREIQGIISDAKSVIWQTEYIGTGSFQIVVSYSDEYFQWLQPDNYVTRNNRTELGFIENINITWNPTDGKIITANGRFGIVLLERRLWADLITSSYRCVTRQYSDNTNLEYICKLCVKETLTQPDWSNRAVSWLSIEASQGFSATINSNSFVSDNALELLSQEMKTAYDSVNHFSAPLGHRMVFDRPSKNMTYQVYQGRKTDLIFSQQYNNLLTFEYSYDSKQFKTAFLIVGEGEGADKFFTQRDRTYATGENRREYVFDSQKSKTGIEINGSTITLTDAQYAQLLQRDCAANFSAYSTNQNVKGTVDVSNLELDVDYKLGDIVTIRDEETQINTSARIWSITEVQDDNGYNITADFEGEG